MAVNIHLKIAKPEVPGESVVEGHAKEIQLLSWKWGMSRTGSTHIATGGTSGKVSVQDLELIKNVDSSSSELMKMCCLGTHIESATLTMDKATGDAAPLSYVELKLTNGVIASVVPGGHLDADQLTEKVTLNFAKFEYKYTPQDTKHSGGTVCQFGFNVAENKPL